MTLEDIGVERDALLCMTNQTSCCKPPYSHVVLGNWFLPNETRVPSSGNNTDFFRDRGQMVVHFERRRGGVDGIYRCEIPNSANVTETIYIGVYTVDNGE